MHLTLHEQQARHCRCSKHEFSGSEIALSTIMHISFVYLIAVFLLAAWIEIVTRRPRYREERLEVWYEYPAEAHSLFYFVLLCDGVV